MNKIILVLIMTIMMTNKAIAIPYDSVDTYKYRGTGEVKRPLQPREYVYPGQSTIRYQPKNYAPSMEFVEVHNGLRTKTYTGVKTQSGYELW